ncbi:MAG: hypothetical protein JNK29_05210 [Anaerolineales bacterium]|nr:hypothetical protein [Anaerolineales bacterium]
MPPAQSLLRRPRAWGLALLTLAALAVAWGLARPDLLTAADQTQPRLDRAAPAGAWRQTFMAGHNGLSAVEVLAVVSPSAPAERSITLRLRGPDGAVLAERTESGVAHNAALRLEFAPLPASAGRPYTLEIDGQAVGVWGYSLDGYVRGELQASGAAPAAPPVPDLRFTTYYTFLPLDMARAAAAALGQLAARALPAWLILFAPGLLILAAAGRRLAWASAWERWGAALALSLAVAPLAWQWPSLAGLRWGPLSLSVAYALAGLAWLATQAWRWTRPRAPDAAPPAGRWSGWEAALAVTLFVGVIARFLAVRDLALPSWVDSPHHLAIARLLAETGQVPAGYQPVLPVDTFTYHFGFHALAVAFHWLTGLGLAETFLWLGQLLNGLAPLAAAGLVLALGGRKPAAFGAAFLVGLVSLFPAYYVSWGRYTQLTGLLILAPLLGFTWRLLRAAGADASASRLLISLAAGLAAGLVLTHYRVLFFYATFVVAAWLVNGARGWRRLAAVAGLSLGLSAPWLVRLAAPWLLPSLTTPATLTAYAGYNNFPLDYFRSPLERAWLAVALLSLAAGAVRRERAAWTLGLWLALTAGLLNVGPGSWLVNNNAWAISLFLPGAGLVGLGFQMAWEGAGRLWARPAGGLPWAGAALWAVLAGALAWAGLRGFFAQAAVVNPATVLATADDQAALEWVAAHTPATAVFLTNSWNWQGDLWSSPDGGAWLWMLTDRQATMPPVDYSFQAEWEVQVLAFNQQLAALTAQPGFSVSAPEFQALLRGAGVTHVYIGARGGGLRPELFAVSSDFQLLYSNGAAWVFEWRPAAQGRGRLTSPLGTGWPRPSWTAGRVPSAAR